MFVFEQKSSFKQFKLISLVLIFDEDSISNMYTVIHLPNRTPLGPDQHHLANS